MAPHDFIFIILAFVSEVIGTISGFGSSTFFVPIAVFLETFGFVLALTAILHCFSNISKIFVFRTHFPKDLIIRLALPSIIFTMAGALLSAHFSSILLTKFLGISLVFISVLTFFKRKRPVVTNLIGASALCGISGFLTGLVGTGGAIRGMALTALQVEKNSFVALSAIIDLGGDLFRAVIYLHEGYMDWKQWFYIPALGIAAILGALVGKEILKKFNQVQFEAVVTFFILLSGLLMLFR